MTCTRGFLLPAIMLASLLVTTETTRGGPVYENSPAPAVAVPEDNTIENAARLVIEGKSDEALALIRQGAATHPEWPPARLILGRLLFVANQVPQARRELELAAAEAPGDPRSYQGFATLALTEGRFNDAQLNCEKILAVLEKSDLVRDAGVARAVRRDAHAGLASVAEARSQWGTAADHLRLWLDLDPTNVSARQRLGRALFGLKRPDEAFRELKRAAADDPKLDPAPVSMALLFSQAGDHRKAEEWFIYARKVAARDPRVSLSYARWLLDQGKTCEARGLADEAAKLDSGSSVASLLRGLIAWQVRDFALAERLFEPLHRDAPTDIAIADLLARSLIEQDDSAKRTRALQLAEMNLRRSPGSADALATIGWAQYRLGRYDLAEPYLRASVANGQASSDVTYVLARLLADRGKTTEARALLVSATTRPADFAFKDEATRLLASLEPRAVLGPKAPDAAGRP